MLSFHSTNKMVSATMAVLYVNQAERSLNGRKACIYQRSGAWSQGRHENRIHLIKSAADGRLFLAPCSSRCPTCRSIRLPAR